VSGGPLILRIADERDGYEILWGDEVMRFLSVREVADSPGATLDRAVREVKRRIRVRRFVDALREQRAAVGVGYKKPWGMYYHDPSGHFHFRTPDGEDIDLWSCDEQTAAATLISGHAKSSLRSALEFACQRYSKYGQRLWEG
jgi:hypothetical protein